MDGERVKFELFIAARYLRAKRRQAVIGIITGISVAGVAAGVMSLIIALAITNGMQRDLQDRLLSSTAHVDLMRIAADGISDWQTLLARLKQQPHVTAAAPGLYGQVLVSRGAKSGGALIKGIIPADERTVSGLLQQVNQGSAEALEKQGPIAIPPIVIGKDLAETIGAAVGDTVLVTSPQGGLTPIGIVPKYQRYTVAGIFHSGFYQYDSTYTFMRLADAQRLFSEPDLISVISFKVDDLYKADVIAREIEEAAGKGFQTTNWMEQNRELFRALKLEQIVTFIVLALIVCVAALNILIALTMMVMEKTRDIAILKTMGASTGSVRRIFMLQGLIIGLAGTTVGASAGYALCRVLDKYKLIRIPMDVYQVSHVPFKIQPLDFTVVIVTAVLICFVATLYPSRQASKLDPVQALRFE